jgi:hypothetical protein
VTTLAGTTARPGFGTMPYGSVTGQPYGWARAAAETALMPAEALGATSQEKPPVEETRGALRDRGAR